jgi:hypothetical protein
MSQSTAPATSSAVNTPRGKYFDSFLAVILEIESIAVAPPPPSTIAPVRLIAY